MMSLNMNLEKHVHDWLSHSTASWLPYTTDWNGGRGRESGRPDRKLLQWSGEETRRAWTTVTISEDVKMAGFTKHLEGDVDRMYW